MYAVKDIKLPTEDRPLASAPHVPISPELIADVCARLAENKPVRQTLPGGGQLNIERLLPFLCVYRRNPLRPDPGTHLFVNAEAAFLNALGDAPERKGLALLVKRIAETAAARLGAFLLLEIWSSDDDQVPRAVDEITRETLLPPPAFRILTRQPHRPEGTVATLEFALQRMRVNRQSAVVDIDLHARNHAPGMTQLISAADAQRINCHIVGLEVRPIYRDHETRALYPQTLRTMRRGIHRALTKAFFRYALNRTNVRPQHFYSLGRKSLPQRVWSVDRQLAEVSGQFKFLLQVTPINSERAWHEFQAARFQRPPVFEYRPLGTDPLLLKRRLLNIPTEQVEDPIFANVFQQTQDELDRQITMLADVGSRRFLPGSLQVFGGVESSLLDLACQLLAQVPRASEESGQQVTAVTFARRATEEIAWYRQQAANFMAQAVIREDMYSGLLSTGGNLLIGRETKLAERRVEALLQHEIGTHLVTYYNGQMQPMRLLKVGLAGYDGLQEGLAVLSEYLVGGLSPGRLRTLAARVVATDQLIRGASFVETFRLLTETHAFEPRTAYTITARVYRGGGLTKDAIYLRGLVEILDFVRRNGDLKLLLVGKIAADHIPIVRELLQRGVLRPPPLHPRYLDDPRARAALARVQQSTSLLDLLAY